MKTETRNGNLSIIDHSSLPNSLLFDELLEEKAEQPAVFVGFLKDRVYSIGSAKRQ